MTKKIIVIGGGPAGMMAAIRAGQLNGQVTLIEKNSSPGKKLLLTGKGRCNLTNACGLDAFLERFSDGGQFLRDAFKVFFNRDLMDFFEARGVRLKAERQGRVFPEGDSSSDILEALKKELILCKVKIIYGSGVTSILAKGKEIIGAELENGSRILCDKVILATGGMSYGFTGSTGEGIEMARQSGHRIVPLLPGLVALETKERYPKLLEGLTLKNIRLKFKNGKKEIVSEVGELLFTSFGISGPLVLSLSGKITDWLEESKNVCLEIDLKPALSHEQLAGRFVREFNSNPNKAVKNMLKTLLPQRLIDVFTGIVKIDGNKKICQVTQEERRNLVCLCKSFRMDISKSRPLKEAMITRGGVSLKDIDPRTMESRLVEGLYFAGEIIDVDADTGGFNLQAAFSTGYLAGQSAGK
jgi:predicted Rossmann fold flavoprotein